MIGPDGMHAGHAAGINTQALPYAGHVDFGMPDGLRSEVRGMWHRSFGPHVGRSLNRVCKALKYRTADLNGARFHVRFVPADGGQEEHVSPVWTCTLVRL
jgi:hypothetical protein